MPRAREVEIPEIKVVKKALADGSDREYHYAFGRGPAIWQTGCSYAPGSHEYWDAFVKAREREEKLLADGVGRLGDASRKGQTSKYQAEAEQLIRAAHASGLTVCAIELAKGRILVRTERAKEKSEDRWLREDT